MATLLAKQQIRWKRLLFSLLLSCLLAGIGLLNLRVDTDVIGTLPRTGGVLSDALEIFANHPMLEQIAIDVTMAQNTPDQLVKLGDTIETKLRQSGLFTQVGTRQFGDLIPALALHSARNLPLLFSGKELQQRVSPLLTPDAIRKRLQTLVSSLNSLEGIGQAQFIALDPLALKDLVLSRMALLAPTMSGTLYRGHLLSANGRHLLITARPAGRSTDSKTAHAIASLLQQIRETLHKTMATTDFTMTPVGAFRAALDNETIIRHDVNMALILAMAGIALLLTIAFSRPLIGLLSLLPAVAGTGAALFVYSLFNNTISIMVLGFGGAVISITVDHGIAYLLFLDRTHPTRGADAATEVRAVGLMAVFTTVGAFLILCMSGFPLFTQLGLFTALGVLFSFIFVHTVFPRVFPKLSAAPRRNLPLQKCVDTLASTGRPGAIIAAGIALALLFVGSPSFDVSLESMNTVSRETRAADDLFTATWGSLGQNILLMTSGSTLKELHQHDRELLGEIDNDRSKGILQSAFLSSMLFPDQATAQQNFHDWQKFWTGQRLTAFKQTLATTAAELGFSPDAFTDFFQLFNTTMPAVPAILPQYFPLLGIAPAREKKGYVRFITLVPGEHYNGDYFQHKYHQYGTIYDPGYFSSQLGQMLFSTFTRIFLIIGCAITLMLLLSYLSIPLTLITLLPVAFAYVCTLGSLKLLGKPLDIPSLMLSIVILGMGIDYSIFFVRAHQRFRSPEHPSYGRVRLAVFMAAASTLIGFGVLATARHSLLHSIGITCLFGIGYSLLGAFLLLPPLLNWYFEREHNCPATAIDQRVLCRFRLLEAYPRMFARFKLRYDPMFTDLPSLLPDSTSVNRILDIGCGYGVPAAWCLEYFPHATLSGVDPDEERARVANLVLKPRGKAFCGWATDISPDEPKADLILLLDMLHYIDDQYLEEMFCCCAAAAQPGTILLVRYTVAPQGKVSLLWHVEQLRIQLQKMNGHYRDPHQIASMVQNAGFLTEINAISKTNPELFWLQAKKE